MKIVVTLTDTEIQEILLKAVSARFPGIQFERIDPGYFSIPDKVEVIATFEQFEEKPE